MQRVLILLLACGVFAFTQTASAQCDGGAPDGSLVDAEACDDGNATPGDGCSPTCTIESGWSCDRPATFTSIEAENYPGASASWSVAADGRSATQNTNTGHGTVGIMGADSFDATYTFTLRVNTAADDDFIGFVVGYNSGDVSSASADFLLLDWKQLPQTAFGGTAPAGLALSRVQGIPTTTNLWAHNGAVSELARATNLGSTGWSDLTDHEFRITHTPTRLLIVVDGATEFDITAADAGYPAGFPPGEIGFYGFSQPTVNYTINGPFGSSSCNRAPTAGNFEVWRDLGSGTTNVSVLPGFSDPDGDGADGGSVSVTVPPAMATVQTPSGGAPSGSVNVTPMPDTTPLDYVMTYEICDDHPTVPLCDTGTITIHTNACGDGELRFAETCDDGNTVPGDGCSATCREETGFDCTMVAEMLSVCSSVCGDGRVVMGEECDDDNMVSGDGCSAACAIEAGWTCDRPITFTDIRDENYPGAAANWEIADGGRSATQTVNSSHGTIGLMDADAFDGSYTFTLNVDTTSDDDFIGFVVGYNPGDVANPAADYLLIDWKQTSQMITGANALEGMVLSRVQGIPTPTQFWGHTGAVTELVRATNLGSTGWSDLTDHVFVITQTATNLTVMVDGMIEFSISASDAGYPAGFPAGEIGFYGYSQPDVRYTVSGPFGATSCNRPPVVADFELWRDLGSGPINVPVTPMFSDPDSDSPDPDSVLITAPPSMAMAQDPGSGAPSGSVTVTPSPDTVAMDYVLTYRLCDDHPTVPLCDEGRVVIHTNRCGDGTLRFSEACDDGNNADLDGCSSTCMIEPGFMCTDVPTEMSMCTSDCGDGIVAAGAEACDDGNRVSGDGCSMGCMIEDGFVCADGSPSICAPCLDTMMGAGLDTGCTAATPICDTSGDVNECVACLDDMAGGATDTGCSAGNGICDDSEMSHVCVPCEAIAGSPDDGCADPTAVCDEGAAPRMCVECAGDIDCAGGEVCDLSSNTCAPCVDTATGGATDSGCSADTPICAGAGDDAGCVVCVDDTSGAQDLGCTESDPVCDTTADPNGTCVLCEESGAVDNGCDADVPNCATTLDPLECRECLMDADCDDLFVCNPAGMCVPGCRTDADCTDTPETPVCETMSDACVECLSATHCDESELCAPDFTCVGCLADTDCEGSLVCDPESRDCVGCLVDTDCEGGLVCSEDNECVDECNSDADCIALDPTQPVCDEGVCVECAFDSDCEDGLVCAATNTCEPECESDADCTGAAVPACDPDAMICVECVTDEHCEDGETCLGDAHVCVSTGCTMDSDCADPAPHCDVDDGICRVCVNDEDCGGGLVCTAGGTACVECDDDSDCPMGVCDEASNMCVGCVLDADCEGDLTCDPRTGACVGGCTMDSDCDNPRFPVCEVGTGACVECLMDDDCVAGELCFPGNYCAPRCEDDAACPDGTVCDETDGMCVECSADEDCEDGRVCHPSDRVCVDGCVDDGDCTDPARPACGDESLCVECTESNSSVCESDPDGSLCLDEGDLCGCTDDSHCAEGRVCDTDTSACVDAPPPGCTDDSECAAGEMCVEGDCVPTVTGGAGGLAGGSLCTVEPGSAPSAPIWFAALIALVTVRRRR